MFEIFEWWKSVLLGAVAVIGAIVTLTGWGRSAGRWAYDKLLRRSVHHETTASHANPSPGGGSRPLRFVLDDHQSFWHLGGVKGEPATQICGHWHVTNVTERNVVILKARVVGHDAYQAHVTTGPSKPHGMWSSKNPIPKRSKSEVSADFFFRPPICAGDAPFLADVVFTDNYGDEHTVTGVTFRRR